jgi:hypothetical protein
MRNPGAAKSRTGCTAFHALLWNGIVSSTAVHNRRYHGKTQVFSFTNLIEEEITNRNLHIAYVSQFPEPSVSIWA